MFQNLNNSISRNGLGDAWHAESFESSTRTKNPLLYEYRYDPVRLPVQLHIYIYIQTYSIYIYNMINELCERIFRSHFGSSNWRCATLPLPTVTLGVRSDNTYLYSRYRRAYRRVGNKRVRNRASLSCSLLIARAVAGRWCACCHQAYVLFSSRVFIYYNNHYIL